MKINIAFIIGQLSHGGAEKQLYLISKLIDKNRFNPIVICLSKDNHPWGLRIERLGINIIYIPRISRFDLSRVFKLVWYFYKYKIDLIVSYLHSANVYTWLARKIYFRNTTYIAQVRSKESNMNKLTRVINISAFNSSKFIITNTHLLKPFIVQFFKQSPGKIFVVKNGIELSENKNRRDDGIINFCTAGKDTKAKNIDLLIKLALKLIPDFQNIHFNLCGRGLDIGSRTYNMVPESYKSFFTFHGEIDNIDIFYENNDIYLSTSRSEGSPNSIIEAMSYGLVVVATDVGGVSELVKHNKTGFLADSENILELFNYCKNLINNVNLCLEMSTQAKKIIYENYSSQTMTKEFEDIFDKV